MRYHVTVTGCNLDLYVNGTSSGVEATVADVPPIDWDAVSANVNTSSSVDIYIGSDLNTSYPGMMDEVRCRYIDHIVKIRIFFIDFRP